MSEISGVTPTDQNQNPDTTPNPTPTSTDPSQQPPAPTPAPADPASDPSAPAPESQAAPSPWGEDLDDELKQFVGEKTPAEIAKELQGAQKLIGKKAIGIPGKDSTIEEQRAFHEARGVPKDPTGYQFDSVKEEILPKMPEGMEWDEDQENWFREAARNSNISNGEASEFLKNYLSREIEQNGATFKQQAEAAKQTNSMIVEQWGSQHEQKTAAANRALHHLGMGQETIDVFLSKAAGNAEARVKFANLMAEMGMDLSENSGPGAPPPQAGGMSAEQAREAKVAFLAQGDNEAAYQDSGHPRHKQVTDQMTQYLKIERGIK